VHAFPEALVADTLKQAGHDVVYVGCGGVFQEHCVCMSARGLAEADAASRKQAVCASCGSAERRLRDEFNFAGYQLAQVLTAEDRAQAREQAAQITPETLLAASEDGIPIGRYAVYEYLLNKKKRALSFTAGEWQECSMHLRNAFLALHAGRRILEREKPQRVLVYNSLYSVNRIFCALAEASGATAYFAHAGLNLSNRLETLLLGRHNTLRYFGELVRRWPQWESSACDAATASRITDHFLILFRGASLFGYSSGARSAKGDLRARLGATGGQRILVAAMSSYDELFAAQTAGAREPGPEMLFPMQIDWIRALVDYVRDRKDLFLVIRVHPREFPNRRDSTKSEHAAQLEAALSNLPDNASVNWPDDGISLYDLAGEAALFLSAWSSVGKEMTALGLPVLSYCPQLLLYPPALHETATTLPAYQAAIERLLQSDWSLERVRRAYRWLAVEYGAGEFDISDGFQRKEHSFFGRAWRRVARSIDPGLEQRLDGARRAPKLAQAGAIARLVTEGAATPLDLRVPPGARISRDEETLILVRELHRIRVALFGRDASRSAETLCAQLDAAAGQIA
jgi:hypothetical protein